MRFGICADGDDGNFIKKRFPDNEDRRGEGFTVHIDRSFFEGFGLLNTGTDGKLPVVFFSFFDDLFSVVRCGIDAAFNADLTIFHGGRDDTETGFRVVVMVQHKGDLRSDIHPVQVQDDVVIAPELANGAAGIGDAVHFGEVFDLTFTGCDNDLGGITGSSGDDFILLHLLLLFESCFGCFPFSGGDRIFRAFSFRWLPRGSAGAKP